MVLAVKAVEAAIPAAFVVALFTPSEKVPLAPAAGAVKVTTTPATKLPKASVTVAESGVAKAVLIVTLWGVPPLAVIFAGAPVTTPAIFRMRLLPVSATNKLLWLSPNRLA